MFITCGSRIGTILATAALATLTAAVPRPAAAGSFGFGEPKALNTNALLEDDYDFNPGIASSDASTFISMWYSYSNVAGNGEDGDVLFVRSTDGGRTWSDPWPAHANAWSDSGTEARPRLQSDGNLTWVAAWASVVNLPLGTGTDYDIFYVRSTDGGETWIGPGVMNSYAFGDSDLDHVPALATDGNGNWICIWISRYNPLGLIGTDYDVFYSTSGNNGDTWSDYRILNSNAATDDPDWSDDWLGEIQTDGNGRWICIWCADGSPGGTYGADRDMFFSISDDNGESWAPVQPLNQNAATDSGKDSFLWLGLNGYGPSLATDGSGVWLAAWDSLDTLGDTVGSDPDIFFARSIDNGESWSYPQPLNSNAADDPDNVSGSDSVPYVATDGNGNWLAAWITRAFSAPLHTDADVAVSRSTDAGATWTPIAALNVYAATDFEGTDDGVQIACDSGGNWVIAWNGTSGLLTGHDYDCLYASSHDIAQPPQPPLSASQQDLINLIIDIVLGIKNPDQNGDGVIDAADLFPGGVEAP